MSMELWYSRKYPNVRRERKSGSISLHLQTFMESLKMSYFRYDYNNKKITFEESYFFIHPV